MLGVGLTIWLPDGTALEADTMVSASHSREVKASRFVVEDGSTITDHTVVEPMTSEVEAIVTPYPLRPILPAGPGRVDEFWAALERAAADRLVCQVLTGRRTYKQALLLKLSTDDTLDNVGQLRFKVTVQEYRTTTATVVKVKVKRVARHNKVKRQYGMKQAEKVAAAKAAPDTAAAAKILGGP